MQKFYFQGKFENETSSRFRVVVKCFRRNNRVIVIKEVFSFKAVNIFSLDKRPLKERIEQINHRSSGTLTMVKDAKMVGLQKLSWRRQGEVCPK